MRRLMVAIACCCMLTLGVAASGASAASAASMPAEGVFESCPIATQMATCVQRLAVMRQGGVNVVVFPVSETPLSALSAYAAAAHWLGLSIMWETSNQGWWEDPSSSTSMDGQFQSFATGCGCTENGQVLSYMIGWLAAQPATYGYYAADDSMLAPGDGPGVASYVAQIKQVDPNHLVMIGSGDESQTGSYERTADMVGAEIYPVTTSSLMPASSNQDMWDSVAQTATDTQRMADQAGKQSAFILQAFTWGDNLSDGQAIGVCTPSDTQASCYAKLLYPTGDAQLQLRNEVIEHAHPKLILWWSFEGTYGQAGDDTYSIYPTGAVATSRWAGLAAAIQAPAPSTGTKKKTSGGPVAHAASVRHAKVHRSTHGRKHKRRRRRRRHHRRRRHGAHSFVAHSAATR